MLITLVKEAVFDSTDTVGNILHGGNGQSFALDPIATIMLQAGLHASSKEEAFATVHERVEATDQQVAEGFEALLRDLRALDLLLPAVGAPDMSVSFPLSAGNAKQPPGSPDDWCQGPHQRQYMPQGKLLDWEVFLTGRFMNAPLPPILRRSRGYALWNTIRLLWNIGAFRWAASFLRHTSLQELQAREWAMLRATLTPLHAHSALQWRREGTDIRLRVARRELVSCQCLTRLLAPTARCLVRSAAFTCYLRALGLPAQMVVGRARFQRSAHFAFHAWVELDGRVVNDREDLQSGYTQLYRVPADDGPIVLQDGQKEAAVSHKGAFVLPPEGR